MKRSQEQIDELIGKYLAGEASGEEVTFVESWAQFSEDNRFYLNQFRTIFQRSAAVKELQEFDADVAWTKLKGSLSKNDSGSNVIPIRRQAIPIWRIAASLAFIVGAGLFAYKLFHTEPQDRPIVIATTTHTVNDTLPDGSDVFLNKGTQIAYRFDKKNKQHKVSIKGEAYFDIKHDTARNFVIEIDGVYVRDIGTSFNVKAYPESKTIEVVVEKGEVMFYTDTDSGVYLKENGKGVFDKVTRKFNIDQPEVNALSYKTKSFNFSNETLEQVVAELNQVYPRQISVPAKLRGCHLTVSFNDESEEEIVAIIAETLGLKVSHVGNKYVLEGPGCEQ